MLLFIFIILITSIGQSLFAASPSKENSTAQKESGPMIVPLDWEQLFKTRGAQHTETKIYKLHTSLQTVVTADYDLAPGNNGFSLNNFDEIRLLCDDKKAKLTIVDFMLMKPLPDRAFTLHLLKSDALSDLAIDRFYLINKKLFILITKLYPNITISNQNDIVFKLIDAFDLHNQEEQKNITSDMSVSLIDNIVRSECRELLPIKGIKKLILTYYYYPFKRHEWDNIFAHFDIFNSH
ncbi:MAG: hypothetical protein WBQ73_00090 [Candidatus Babeliales bacterium]